jgi:CDP-glucose 4,6-dehydratase
MIDRGFWSGRHVLLTGHTGFKGAWLALWLHHLGADVTGFAGPPPTQPSLFELARVGELLEDRRGDVCDIDAVTATVERARPDVVFHLAAQALVRRSLHDPVGTYAVNVSGTANLLQAIRVVAPDAAVVVVTSDKCYANHGDGRAFAEDDPLGGADPYSSSKAAQELVAAAFRTAFGLRIATARAGNVIGGGDWAGDRLIPDFVRAALTGEPLVVRNPDAVRPWQHVLNPLSGYLVLAERLHRSADWAQAWNFGPPPQDERPVRWMVDAMARRWSRPPPIHATPQRPPDMEATVLRLDSAKARRSLGWEPPRGLEAALDATVNWYQAVETAGDGREPALREIAAIGS